MGDERCEIGPNVAIKGSLENQCSMSSNTFTTTTTPTHHFSTNATTANNNNNNKEQDPFSSTTTTNAYHISTNSINNKNNNNNEQQGSFLQIPNTSNNTHPFSSNPNNNSINNSDQDRFLSISTSTNNVHHFSTNVTSKSSSHNNDQGSFHPISTNADNTQHFSTNASNSNNSGSTTGNNKEQDRFLPIANVGRIMKKFIPGNGKISKDAKETVQECVSEFISFVTGEASDKCQREKRKTINGDDIIWAITTLGFEDYVTPLKQYLNKYRDLEGEKLQQPKHQKLHQNDQRTNMSYNHNVYSSTSLIPQASFIPSDHPFALQFSQNSIQTQLPQHEHIDSVGNW